MVQLKVATLIHIWVDCFSGTWRIQCCPRISRSTRVIILRSATQDKRELRYFMLETSVCSHKLIWALAQLSNLREALKEVDQQVVGFVGLVWSTRSRELMFLKDCVLVIRFSNTMQCEKSNGGDRVLWGKVRKPLQSVQSNHGQSCPQLWTILEYLVVGLSHVSHHI